MESLIAPSINLLILVGFLAYKLKKPFSEFVAQRHHSIRDELLVVREQLTQAREKYDEFSSKLKAIDAEVQALREQAKQDALGMKQKVLTESRRMASIIISDAKVAAEGLYTEVKGQLYNELSLKVLERAENILQNLLTRDDKARIKEEFSRQVENVR